MRRECECRDSEGRDIELMGCAPFRCNGCLSHERFANFGELQNRVINFFFRIIDFKFKNCKYVFLRKFVYPPFRILAPNFEYNGTVKK